MLGFWIAAPVLAFALGFVLTHIGIPFLQKKKMGQTILEIGPNWHMNKQGTPTMGGLFFAAAFTAAFLFCVLPPLFLQSTFDFAPLVCFAFVLFNAVTGFIDDFVKFTKKENKGLTPLQKLIFQFGSAALFILGLSLCGAVDTVLRLPFGLGAWDLGIFYYLFAIVFVVLVVNAVNITDGIDGLAGSNVSIVLVFFAVLSGLEASHGVFAAQPRGIFALSVLGGVLAFLCFNRYPAKIFMGDTGSLFLGGVLACLAVWADLDLVLVFAGIVFLFEAASSVLQTAYFKLTHGKRIFKMAPFHHHLEKCGYSENKIVALFCIVTTLGCVLSYFAF